jgi:hypothetical protein
MAAFWNVARCSLVGVDHSSSLIVYTVLFPPHGTNLQIKYILHHTYNSFDIVLPGFDAVPRRKMPAFPRNILCSSWGSSTVFIFSPDDGDSILLRNLACRPTYISKRYRNQNIIIIIIIIGYMTSICAISAKRAQNYLLVYEDLRQKGCPSIHRQWRSLWEKNPAQCAWVGYVTSFVERGGRLPDLSLLSGVLQQRDIPPPPLFTPTESGRTRLQTEASSYWKQNHWCTQNVAKDQTGCTRRANRHRLV